jgi:ribosome biogenesis GTPase
VHRSGSIVLSERGSQSVTLPPRLIEQFDRAVTVGDWVLIENEAARAQRILAAYGVITRVAAGTEHRLQAIAANLDTLFVVTSCNHDFNRSRLERYLAVAYEARVEPVIVLTKSELCDHVDDLIDQARSLANTLQVVAVNATEPNAAASLDAWVQSGQTVAFVGESESGCAVLAAIAAGQLDPRRLASYRKLQREAALSTMSTAARRERDRRFGRLSNSALQIKRKNKE